MTDLTSLEELDPAVARDWIERWDRQQDVYLANREDRFTALIDAVEAGTDGAGTDGADPLVLDLGCGPGSLAVRLLRRIPGASVLAVDADPVTLALGAAAYADMPGLRFLDLDLRTRGWQARLGLEPGRPVDAVVSTTALHWLSALELRSLYATLAGLLRPGGLFLDGDHLRLDEAASPVLSRLERELEERESQRRFAAGQAGRAEDWAQWWEAIAADPVLAPAAAERERRRVESGHHASESTQLAVHTGALRSAGFAEIGTLWQRGGDRLLCAVR
jgi:SAM-dependent methyltransferase